METENHYEIEWWESGKTRILGMDEAGRGPIAGPLVVAGVVFPKGYHHEAIYDSKKLSEKKREALFEVIQQDALAYHIEIVSPQTIDEENIYRATPVSYTHLRAKKNNYLLHDQISQIVIAPLGTFIIQQVPAFNNANLEGGFFICKETWKILLKKHR